MIKIDNKNEINREDYYIIIFINGEAKQKIQKLLDCKAINRIIIFLIRMPRTKKIKVKIKNMNK